MSASRFRRMLMPSVCAVAALLATAAVATPANDTLPSDLAKAAAQYDQAQIKGDKAALERLVADDYVLVNSGAKVQGKSELIEGYTSPGNSIDPYVVVDKVEKVLGRDAAILAGKVTLKGHSDGAPFTGQLRFADIWQRRHGVWKVVFTEVTRVPSPK